jgi:hypothetical protein
VIRGPSPFQLTGSVAWRSARTASGCFKNIHGNAPSQADRARPIKQAWPDWYQARTDFVLASAAAAEWTATFKATIASGKKVTDLNGDGKADLLARDTSGVLWFYPGNGKGSFSTRTRIGSGWNAMNALA